MSSGTNPTAAEDSQPTNEPDPSDLEPLGDSEGVYQRDEHGELRPLPPEAVEIDGEWRQVRFYPVPIGQLDDYRELGEDMAMRELCDIMAEKVHTPNRTVDEWADTDPEQFMPILMALVERAVGETPSSDFHAEVQRELDGRDSPGN